MTVGAKGSWDFVLPFRGTKLLAMALVGVAVAVSTVMFQTVTDNRILTPSIMGFDALYLLLQTTLVFSIGSARMTAIPAPAKFLLESAVMVTFGVLLYRWLLSGRRRSVHVLVLAGIVLGVFFRSLSSFMTRLIDPNEFQVLQDAMFASFNSFDRSLVWLAALLLGGAVATAWALRRRLDVLLLGRERATMLGVDHQRTVGLVLVVVAVLVSVSTALVGPITFFGLLVANLAYRIAGSHRHAVVMPVAALLGVLALVAGQTVLEQVFEFDTALAVIIEFLGGIVFLALLMRGDKR
ncbi:MAG: iron chelate uptake ABC transporter family permease subunit [Actinomycetales bacterium]|nr:iron chelate uptake ABC transporter family permease subunit [Actinomycetales bacterium]